MSIKQEINYALILLTIQETDLEFSFYNNEEDINDDFELIKVILLALSSSRYLVPRTYNISKSQQWWYEILPLYDNIRFKKILRMEQQQFNKLVQILQHDTIFQNKGNKP